MRKEMERFVYTDNYKYATRSELLRLLEKYRGILNISMQHYLEAAIDLDFSVLNSEILCDSYRNALSQLDIFKRVSIYNINYRALKILDNSGLKIDISGKPASYDGGMKASFDKIPLYSFTYTGRATDDIEPFNEDYTTKVGKIDLYQVVEDKNIRKEEINSLMKRLDRLYNTKNPYSLKEARDYMEWDRSHIEQIRRFEERIDDLNKSNLTDKDIKEIEATNYIYNMFVRDYNLREGDFDEIKTYHPETLLTKTYVKKMPNVEIQKNVKYI